MAHSSRYTLSLQSAIPNSVQIEDLQTSVSPSVVVRLVLQEPAVARQPSDVSATEAQQHHLALSTNKVSGSVFEPNGLPSAATPTGASPFECRSFFCRPGCDSCAVTPTAASQSRLPQLLLAAPIPIHIPQPRQPTTQLCHPPWSLPPVPSLSHPPSRHMLLHRLYLLHLHRLSSPPSSSPSLPRADSIDTSQRQAIFIHRSRKSS